MEPSMPSDFYYLADREGQLACDHPYPCLRSIH